MLKKNLFQEVKKHLDKVTKKVYTLQHGKSVSKRYTNITTTRPLSRSLQLLEKVRLFFVSFSFFTQQPKEGIMNFPNTRGAKALLFAATAAIIISLTACGGGGGGSSDTGSGVSIAPIPTGPTATSLSITAGKLLDGGFDLVSPVSPTASLSSSFTVVGDVGTVSINNLSLSCGGTNLTVSAVVSGTKVNFVNAPLPAGACQLSGDLVGSKASGTDAGPPTTHFSYQFTVANTAVTYPQMAMIFINGYVGSGGKIGIYLGDEQGTLTPVANASSYQSGDPETTYVNSCSVRTLPDTTLSFTAVQTATGEVPVECTVAEFPQGIKTWVRRNLLVNPATKSLHDDTSGATQAGVLVNVYDYQSPSATLPAPYGSLKGLNTNLGNSFYATTDVGTGGTWFVNGTIATMVHDHQPRLMVQLPAFAGTAN